MDPTIIVAIVSGAFTLIGSFIGILVNSKLTNYRIEQLEKKVDKHNGLIERMTVVETKLKDMEKDNVPTKKAGVEE